MRKVYLSCSVAAVLVVALGVGAHLGAARQPQAAGGPAPGKLPDVLGITTGMPLQQAIDLMKAHDPSHSVIIRNWLMPQAFEEKPVVYQLSTAATGEDDTLDVDITLPPQPQVVWQIHRALGSQHRITSTLSNVVNGLYQKYGTPWNSNPPQPVNPAGLQWIFDEQGRPVNPSTPADITTMKACLNTTMQAWVIFGGTFADTAAESGKPVQVYHVPPRGSVVNMPAAFDPTKNPQCNNLVLVRTILNAGSAHDNDLQFVIAFTISDYTLQHRTAGALNDVLNAAVRGVSQKQQDDISKAPLPKL